VGFGCIVLGLIFTARSQTLIDHWPTMIPRRKSDARGSSAKGRLAGQQYRVVCTLYSKYGKRAAEVREFRNGETYLLEREQVHASTFEDRHSGRMVGPFASPADVENFIVATAWFRGREG